MMSGEVPLSFAIAASVTAQINAGKQRAIAVTGFFAPARTPATIINRLNREALRILARTDLKAKSLNTGAQGTGSTPQELAHMVSSDTAKWEQGDTRSGYPHGIDLS